MKTKSLYENKRELTDQVKMWSIADIWERSVKEQIVALEEIKKIISSRTACYISVQNVLLSAV
jgi:hypothetical protein